MGLGFRVRMSGFRGLLESHHSIVPMRMGAPASWKDLLRPNPSATMLLTAHPTNAPIRKMLTTKPATGANRSRWFFDPGQHWSLLYGLWCCASGFGSFLSPFRSANSHSRPTQTTACSARGGCSKSVILCFLFLVSCFLFVGRMGEMALLSLVPLWAHLVQVCCLQTPNRGPDNRVAHSQPCMG